MFYCFCFITYIRFFVKILIAVNVNLSKDLNFSVLGCSKLMMTLVNVSLKFQMLIS